MHPEAIILKRRKIFEKLKNFPEFYLVGGTALALQIGHRISVDFDMFWEKDISTDILDKVRRIFQGLRIKVVREHSEQLSVIIEDVKVDFVKYPFPLLFRLTRCQGVNLVNVREIAVMKAYAIGRRPILKDYIDLYYILKGGYVTLQKIIELSQKKYHNEFSARLFLEQLIYLKDVQEMEVQFSKKPVGKEEMEKFFRRQTAKIKL